MRCHPPRPGVSFIHVQGARAGITSPDQTLVCTHGATAHKLQTHKACIFVAGRHLPCAGRPGVAARCTGKGMQGRGLGGVALRAIPGGTDLEAQEPRPCRNVLGLAPYDAVSSLAAIRELPEGVEPLKLDWNESTIPPSPRVIEAIVKFLENAHHLNWYPDLGARRLREALASYTGVPAERILVTNGSDDGLDLLCRTYVEGGDDVVVAWPTYGHFLVFARARGVEPRLVMPPDPFEVPAAALRDAIRPDTKVVYVASPNNPTGVVTPVEEVARLCRGRPGTLFIVDEAYYEFSGVTCTGLLAEMPNLVVARTFSKCFGIAGLRVGYMMASDSVIAHLSRLYNPKSVNALGQVGALAALEDIESRKRYVREVREARSLLVKELLARGATVRGGEANFVMVRVSSPHRLVKALESVGVFVRDRSQMKGLEGFVRITVGTVEHMRDLLGRIDRLLQVEPDLLH